MARLGVVVIVTSAGLRRKISPCLLAYTVLLRDLDPSPILLPQVPTCWGTVFVALLFCHLLSILFALQSLDYPAIPTPSLSSRLTKPRCLILGFLRRAVLCFFLNISSWLRAWGEGWRSLVSLQKPKVQSQGYRPMFSRSPPSWIFCFCFNTVLVKSFQSIVCS